MCKYTYTHARAINEKKRKHIDTFPSSARKNTNAIIESISNPSLRALKNENIKESKRDIYHTLT
jgi:hypothetical protein